MVLGVQEHISLIVSRVCDRILGLLADLIGECIPQPKGPWDSGPRSVEDPGLQTPNCLGPSATNRHSKQPRTEHITCPRYPKGCRSESLPDQIRRHSHPALRPSDTAPVQQTRRQDPPSQKDVLGWLLLPTASPRAPTAASNPAFAQNEDTVIDSAVEQRAAPYAWPSQTLPVIFLPSRGGFALTRARMDTSAKAVLFSSRACAILPAKGGQTRGKA